MRGLLSDRSQEARKKMKQKNNRKKEGGRTTINRWAIHVEVGEPRQNKISGPPLHGGMTTRDKKFSAIQKTTLVRVGPSRDWIGCSLFPSCTSSSTSEL